MSLPHVVAPVGASRTTHTNLVERFFRDRESIWQQIASEQELPELVRELVSWGTIMLGAYGVVLGLSQGPLQAAVSAIKLPLLYLLTLAICLPALYLFNLFSGGRMTAWQLLALALTAVTFPAALALGFAPISLFFRITAPHYAFYVLVNVGILTLTGIIALELLAGGVRHINKAGRERENAPRMVSAWLLAFWLPLYGVIGTQLAWTLRPFFGIPGEPFVLFRPIESNFLMAIIRLLAFGWM